MKKTWEEPRILVQKFMPNEYVAACGDSGKVYKFECNAGDEWGGYSVYLNGPDGEAHTKDDIFWCGGRDAELGPVVYTRCGKKHSAEDNNDFFPGYIQRSGILGGTKEEKVIVWTENGKNAHCTTNLNMDSWETEKS